MASKGTTENLAYHAGRILLLLLLCGKPRGKASERLPGIESRTLLAKLDFFVRYPEYLRKAAEIMNKEISDVDLGLVTREEERSIEAQMVRFFYGPWDHIYYMTLAYLVGKELITIERSDGRGTEIFRLTEKGNYIGHQIAEDTNFKDLSSRANTVYRLFNSFSGNRLKNFIYTNFP